MALEKFETDEETWIDAFNAKSIRIYFNYFSCSNHTLRESNEQILFSILFVAKDRNHTSHIECVTRGPRRVLDTKYIGSLWQIA